MVRLLRLFVCVLAFATPAFAGDEKLSDVEKLKIEKAQLLATIAELSRDRAAWRLNFSQCTAQLGQNEAQGQQQVANAFSDDLVKEIEKAHKGYTLNAKGELVKKPEEKKQEQEQR